MRFSPTYSILRKELRALGGLWIAMIMLCAVVQMSLLMVSEFQVTRIHDLTAALFGASLILAAAYAAGSTGVLFAMEHEAGTFGLLRRLPISPRRIFFSKLLWPALSLLAFWAVAWPLSRLFASSFPSVPRTGMLWALWGVGAAETFAWGTFFSLRSRRPLVAAFLGLTVTGLSAYLATILYIRLFGNPSGTVVGAYAVAWPMRLLFALAVGAVDVALGLRWFDMSKTLETEPSAGARSGGAWGERWQPRLFGRTRTFFSLIWQHWRQLRSVVGCLALGFVPLGVFAFTSTYGSDPQFWMTIVTLIAIATFPIGASLLFMPDQRRRSYRFLAHHGASPSTVWWSRQTLGAILATIGTVAFFFLLGKLIWYESQRNTPGLPGEPRDAVLFLGTILIAYAGGQFVSLVLRSPIIAGVVGCAITCVLLAWMVLTQYYLVLPEWMFQTSRFESALNVLCQSAEAFALAVVPILIALILASRLHVKDWLSDHVSRRSHLRWAGILGMSFVIVYACLPILRFANAPAYTDPGFSVVEFERAQEEPRVKEGAKLLERLDRDEGGSAAALRIDPDGPLAKRLIEFGKDGPLPIGLQGRRWGDSSYYFRGRMGYLFHRLEEEERRLDAIALLRTWVVLAPVTGIDKRRSMEKVLSRLYTISSRENLSSEELQAAIELTRELTPRFTQISDRIKWEHLRLQETLGVPMEQSNDLRWPRQLVLTLAPWEKSVFLRFLNHRSRSDLEFIREFEEEMGNPEYRPPDGRDWDYWRKVAGYATFGNPTEGWNLSCWYDAAYFERTRRAVLLCLLVRRWQMEHGGELPESLELLARETEPEILVDFEHGHPFVLNKKGQPFSFETRGSGIDVDVVSANVPYITCVDDDLENFDDVEGASANDEEIRTKRRLHGPAWPVYPAWMR